MSLALSLAVVAVGGTKVDAAIATNVSA